MSAEPEPTREEAVRRLTDFLTLWEAQPLRVDLIYGLVGGLHTTTEIRGEVRASDLRYLLSHLDTTS